MVQPYVSRLFPSHMHHLATCHKVWQAWCDGGAERGLRSQSFLCLYWFAPQKHPSCNAILLTSQRSCFLPYSHLDIFSLLYFYFQHLPSLVCYLTVLCVSMEKERTIFRCIHVDVFLHLKKRKKEGHNNRSIKHPMKFACLLTSRGDLNEAIISN